jgi:hypothetical protein
MKDEKTKQKELLEIYRIRLHDRSRFSSKRYRAVQSRPDRLEGLVENFFKGDRNALKKIDENRAIMAWAEIVGPAVARVSQPIRIRGTTLVVRVQDPLWMQQLSLLKHELIKKYQVGFPKLNIKDIYFTRQ